MLRILSYQNSRLPGRTAYYCKNKELKKRGDNHEQSKKSFGKYDFKRKEKDTHNFGQYY